MEMIPAKYSGKFLFMPPTTKGVLARNNTFHNYVIQ